MQQPKSVSQSVQSLSRVRLFATPWTAAHQASLSITNSQNLLKLISIESVMPSSHLILCHPLFLLPQSLPASGSFQMSQFFPSGSQSIRVSASACPSNRYSGLISFRMDWLDLLAVQGTLKRLFQHHSSKASTFRCSAFFTVQICVYRCKCFVIFFCWSLYCYIVTLFVFYYRLLFIYLFLFVYAVHCSDWVSL